MRAILAATLLLLLLISALPQAASTQTYPVVRKGVVGIQLRERGALLMDSFGGESVDTEKWRIWHSNPESVTLSVEDGRFMIRTRDRIHYNGLWSLNPARHKDATLVGKMNIETTGSGKHSLLLHLCGGDMPSSPDHWIEVAMTDLDGGQAGFQVNAAIERHLYPIENKGIILDRGGDEGFLARLSLDGSSNLCTTEVRDSRGEWHAIAEPIPLHLRTTHCEIKMRGGSSKDHSSPASSVGWFENVRMYPRAISHPVLVRLVLQDGSAPYYRVNRGWPPKIQIGGGPPRDLDELTVELRSADGAKLISSVQSAHFAHYMLPVDHTDWDVFPVGAVFRVLNEGKSLGETPIPLEGLDGLYPNDVYDILLE